MQKLENNIWRCCYVVRHIDSTTERWGMHIANRFTHFSNRKVIQEVSPTITMATTFAKQSRLIATKGQRKPQGCKSLF